MPMTPFFIKHPVLAEREFRTLHITGDPNIPDGEYGFLELYCDEAGCDCRRVFIHVLAAAAPDEGPLATINFGWENKAFYENWMHGSMSEEELTELKGPALAPMAQQSDLAPYFLELFASMLEDPEFVNRLRRHYELFRETVTTETKATSPQRPRPDKKTGPNQPCPCGSGKKFKKCCGNARLDNNNTLGNDS